MWLAAAWIALASAAQGDRIVIPATPLAEHYSSRQLRALARRAKTAQEHQHVAECYRVHAAECTLHEQEQEQVLAEYLANPAKFPAKYPTRGDTAKQLAGYYHLKAAEAKARADEQDRLAEQTARRR